MLTKTFFKLFPPPKFLNIPHAGLTISDTDIRFIEYGTSIHGHFIRRFGEKKLKSGIIESGEIRDENALIEILIASKKEFGINVVKVSLPEERMYLFKTEVPSLDQDEIRQNIEFKLEENVPLPPSEAVFFFDLIPESALHIHDNGKIFASVSVAPLQLVDSYLRVFHAAGITVVSFEVEAKAIASALIPKRSNDIQMILHIMSKKTGVYIVWGEVVCFTSTLPEGEEMWKQLPNNPSILINIQKEIQRVYSYWIDHGEGTNIQKIILLGKLSLLDGLASNISPDPKIPVEVGKVWQNAFSINEYVPPIPYEESLDYAVAAGLAL